MVSQLSSGECLRRICSHHLSWIVGCGELEKWIFDYYRHHKFLGGNLCKQGWFTEGLLIIVFGVLLWWHFLAPLILFNPLSIEELSFWYLQKGTKILPAIQNYQQLETKLLRKGPSLSKIYALHVPWLIIIKTWQKLCDCSLRTNFLPYFLRIKDYCYGEASRTPHLTRVTLWLKGYHIS